MHIEQEVSEATLIGTGDIYECTISKKDVANQKFENLDDVMLNPQGLSQYLTFPSIKGNQEERILHLTKTGDFLRKEIHMMPEKLALENAEVIHGHQWAWGGKPWGLIKAKVNRPITFYGHSHQSALSIDGKEQEIVFDKPYRLIGNEVLVNVGSVIVNEEWVLYDTKENTVTFKRAKKS